MEGGDVRDGEVAAALAGMNDGGMGLMPNAEFEQKRRQLQGGQRVVYDVVRRHIRAGQAAQARAAAGERRTATPDWRRGRGAPNVAQQRRGMHDAPAQAEQEHAAGADPAGDGGLQEGDGAGADAEAGGVATPDVLATNEAAAAAEQEARLEAAATNPALPTEPLGELPGALAGNTQPAAAEQRPPDAPLLMFITGGAGTGKSFVISMLRELVLRSHRGLCASSSVMLLAPTGVAAANIGGRTLHSALKLPVEDVRSNRLAGNNAYRALQGEKLNRLRSELLCVRYIIIDEISMVSAATLLQVHRRLGEATGIADSAYGGKSVIFVGDFMQLPPVASGRSARPQFAFAGQHAHMLWPRPEDCYLLDTNYRQGGVNSWSATLNALRTCCDRELVNEALQTLRTRLVVEAGGPVSVSERAAASPTPPASSPATRTATAGTRPACLPSARQAASPHTASAPCTRGCSLTAVQTGAWAQPRSPPRRTSVGALPPPST